MNAKAILGIIMTLTIVGILIGLVFPVAMDGLNESVTDETTLTVGGDEYNVTSDMTAVAISINGTSSPDTVNITVNDTANDDSYKLTDLEEGDETKLETELGDLNITVNSIDATADEVDVTFTHDKEFGWSSAGRSLYSILGVFLVIILLVVVSGLVLKASKGW